MGQITAKINLSNPRENSLQPMEVKALVDTGAVTLCIPQHIVIQLGLEVLEQREVVTANGQRQKCDYVGPLKIQFANRSCYCGALVLGDSVLLGAIPLEDMDLIIHPSTRTLSVNPESPNIPVAIVKVIINNSTNLNDQSTDTGKIV